MSTFPEQVGELIGTGEGFTYENFARHGAPSRIDDYDGYGSRSRTYPEEVKPDFLAWLQRTGTVLLNAYGEKHHVYKTFAQVRKNVLVGNDADVFREVRSELLGALRGLAADLDHGTVADPGATTRNAASAAEVRLICTRFHQIVVQLRRRREQRPTLDVDDEYDVQDLLHALLKLYFDDVRPEEWTPSYAGSSARMDFLLKDTGMVIEVKKTRNGLADREIGKQLTEDVAHYAQYQGCTHLICFIYDPEDRVANPTALKNDVEKQSRENFAVEVIVGS